MARCAPGGELVMPQENVINIVVLVSGTVDPVNMDPVLSAPSATPSPVSFPLEDSDAKQKVAQKSESGSKKAKDDDWYWQENARFRDELRALRKKYRNLHIFKAHGWTGDNSPSNRRIAGAYLADRLCGGNGEKACYRASSRARCPSTSSATRMAATSSTSSPAGRPPPRRGRSSGRFAASPICPRPSSRGCTRWTPAPSTRTAASSMSTASTT